MRTRKCLAAIALVGTVFASVLGALAIVPHGHGEDLDHSRHEDCAVHQAASAHVEGAAPSPALAAVSLVPCGFVELRSFLSVSVERTFGRGRAPPSALR